MQNLHEQSVQEMKRKLRQMQEEERRAKQGQQRPAKQAEEKNGVHEPEEKNGVHEPAENGVHEEEVVDCSKERDGLLHKWKNATRGSQCPTEKRVWHKLARDLHPDKNPSCMASSTEAITKFTGLCQKPAN